MDLQIDFFFGGGGGGVGSGDMPQTLAPVSGNSLRQPWLKYIVSFNVIDTTALTLTAQIYSSSTNLIVRCTVNSEQLACMRG